MHYLCENKGVWGQSNLNNFLATPFSKPENALLVAKKCPFDRESAPLCKARKLICRVKIEVNITFMFQQYYNY